MYSSRNIETIYLMKNICLLTFILNDETIILSILGTAINIHEQNDKMRKIFDLRIIFSAFLEFS